MIRTVPIPTRVSRMGCTPGGGCCDECGGHSQALGRLGDTACDQDGNCYDTGTGQLLSAPLTTGPGCAPGIPSCAASSGSLGTAALGTYLPAIIIGSVAALLLFTKGGR
jgi:hypothetical protein